MLCCPGSDDCAVPGQCLRVFLIHSLARKWERWRTDFYAACSRHEIKSGGVCNEDGKGLYFTEHNYDKIRASCHF